MSLTGITWLTGEVVDEARLNGLVANTAYVKSLFATIDPYSATSWTATSWATVTAWNTGEIIDDARLNQMYLNQGVLRSVVDSHTVWNFPDEHFYTRTTPLDRTGRTTYNQLWLLANGSKIGAALTLPTNDGVWNTLSVSNIPLDGYDDFEIITLGFWIGDIGTHYKARFVKLPETQYVSFTIKVAKTYGYYSWSWKELVVKAHRTFIN